METKACDVNVPDTEALLPPRKRLLAGLKRQNSDTNPQVHSTPDNSNSDHEHCVLSLLKSQFSDTNISDEDLVESSQFAAAEAVKHAEAARSIAEQKAAAAVKAMEAAKSSLDLLATLTEESAKKEHSLIKKRMKKNTPPETLYGKRKGKANRKKDEELVHKLHQPTTSSPRITKSSSVSDARAQKHKRLKSSDSPEKAGLNNGVVVIKGNANKEDCEKETSHNPEAAKADQNGIVESGNNDISVRSNSQVGESSDSFGRKRGRMKQKKLALTVCSVKDQPEPNDEKKTGETSRSESPFTIRNSDNSVLTVERRAMWKCQAIETSSCVVQNKVTQS